MTRKSSPAKILAEIQYQAWYYLGVHEVRYLPAARAELDKLPAREREALFNAVRKLEALGLGLGYPHSSAVQGTSLRELRPRAGRSPWRAFYEQAEEGFVIAAVGPEAQQDRRGFDRAIRDALERLTEEEQGW